MEKSRAVLLKLVWVSGVWFSRISGAEEVEMRVRPGDTVTLYSDCVWKSGLITVWFRNCSHDRQPPFILSVMNFMNGDRPRYSGVWNPSNQTHDLLVKNVSESDLGLYYCAIKETKLTTDKSGVTLFKDIYHYGNRTTRLSLLDPCFNLTLPTSTPPVSDCSTCWKLLVTVCPLSAVFSSLLSSTCVYCICRTRTKESKVCLEQRGKTKNWKDRTSETVDQVGGGEVCYASLDLPSRQQKPLKKKKIERSAFSTYSEVKTERS